MSFLPYKFGRHLILALVLCGFFVVATPDAKATVLGEVLGSPADPSPKFIPTGRILPVTWSAAVGDTVIFNTNTSYDYQGRSQVTATLKTIGTHAYFYVEDVYFNSLNASEQTNFLSAVQTLANEFDNNIYPKEIQYFGAPWEPGIDNDMRITVLFTRLIDNAGGYFRTDDEYQRSVIASSNEREMIFINATQTSSFFKSKNFLAHEFQHLISFNQKTKLRNSDDEVWLNEARSEYASTILGYNDVWSGSYLQSRALSFLGKPTDSLTEWMNQTYDYAAAALFINYLADQYGTNIITKSLQRSEQGINSINSALTELNQTDRFSDIVLNWEIANYINSIQTGERYGYKNPVLAANNFKLTDPTNSYMLTGSMNISAGLGTKDWAGSWINISGMGVKTLKLNFTPAIGSNVYKTAVILKKNNSTYEVRKQNTSAEQSEIRVEGIGNDVLNVIFVPISQVKTADFTDNEPSRTYTLTMSLIEPSGVTITAVNPAAIHSGGGSTVTVTGTGFKTGLTLKVNNNIVNATLLSSSSLTFVVPKLSGAGNVCIDITNTDGTTGENCTLLRSIGYTDGTLLRARGDTKVWITKGNWRRHIVSSNVISFYPHLNLNNVLEVDPVEINAYTLSAWVRVSMTSDPYTWRIYEVNGDASKHWITCADENNCGTTWLAHGGNPNGIYTINDNEMKYYTEGPRVFLQ